MTSSYLEFQNQSDHDDDIILTIGLYCYYNNTKYCIITDITTNGFDIIDLIEQTKKTVKSYSLKSIKKSKHLKKAKLLHEEYINDNKLPIYFTNAMEMIDTDIVIKQKQTKNKPNKPSKDIIKVSLENSNPQTCCRPKCYRRTAYCICIFLIILSCSIATWFLLYGLPIVNDGNKFEKSLISSKCVVTEYVIIDCSYDCFKCDDNWDCEKCDGPICNSCEGGAYKYAATATSICNQTIVKSKLFYGTCPQQPNNLLTMDVEYNCFVSNDCKSFTFEYHDKGIDIAQQYVNGAWICIGIAGFCLLIMFGIRSLHCIKTLPCME